MSHTYVRPYVETSKNVVKEPANVNLLVCETRTFSSELSSGQINKGGKFLKKLWCCVGRRV